MPWYVLPRTDGKRIWLDGERPDLEKIETPERPAAKKSEQKAGGEDK